MELVVAVGTATASDVVVGFHAPKSAPSGALSRYVVWSIPDSDLGGLAVYYYEESSSFAWIEHTGMTGAVALNTSECDAMCAARSGGCYSEASCAFECRPRLNQWSEGVIAAFATCMVENPLCYQTGAQCAEWADQQ